MVGPIPSSGIPVPDFGIAFSLLPIPFVMVLANDPVFTFIAANKAYVALSGVALEDLLGRGVFDIFPGNPGDPASTDTLSLRKSYRRVIETGASDQMPLFCYSVAGLAGSGLRYFSSINTPVLDANGHVESIIQSVEEITERMLVEQQVGATFKELQTSERRFRQLADTSGFGLIIADQGGGISFANPTALQILGYRAEEVAAGLVRWDQLTPVEFHFRDHEAWREVLETGKCAPYEKVYLAKDGRRVPILIAASVLEALNDRTEVAAIIFDLTERKRGEIAAFVGRLDDETRLLPAPDEVMQTSVRLLGDFLQADRCGYYLFEPDEETLDIVAEYIRPGVPSMAGRYKLGQFGANTERLFRANLAEVVSDMEATGPLDMRATYREAKIRACASVPLHKAGKLVAAVGVHQVTPRKWLLDEVELIQLVANRCWESIERIRANRALLLSERRLRLAQKAGHIGSFEWLIRENRITWTPELEALYDLPEGAFDGTLEGWRNLVVPEDVHNILGEVEKCLAQRASDYHYEFRAILPDGTLRWLRGQGQFFYDHLGPNRMVGVNIDINAQKQAEARLQQQWHMFDTVLSNTPDAVYIFDLAGRFKYANRTLLSRLHVSLDQIIGKDGSALGYPPKLVERIKGQIQEVSLNARVVRDDMPITPPGQETRHYEYILVPVFDEDGKVEAVAGSTRDITERKLAEEQERKHQEQLRESTHLESLGILAGGIAHDFNNLLTSILGNASLLADDGPEQGRSLANQIILAAERAAELTSQMLAYSGKGRFITELVNLNTLVQDTLTLLLASLPLSVIVELELSREGCGVEGDRAQMQQIVKNLLMNAAEAYGDRRGRVVVRTEIVEWESSRESKRLQTVLRAGRYAVLEVRDFGSGMAPEILNKIFDPFFTTKFTGRGLGLAAVLGIVKRHLGDIEVETEEGRGTLFKISLPAAPPLEAAAGVSTEMRQLAKKF